MARCDAAERLERARRMIVLAEQSMAERAAAIERGDKLRVWQLRKAERNLKEAKDAMMTLETENSEPQMVYIVKRQLKLGGRIFDRGCEATAAELGPNLESFLRAGSIAYLPRNRAATGVNK